MKIASHISARLKIIILITYIHISVCLVASYVQAGGQGSERQYPIPGHGVLKLDVPESWVDRIDQPPNDLPPTIIFSPPSGESFKILITAMWSPTDDEDFNKPSKIKSGMERRGLTLLPKAEETELKLQELKGPSCRGYCFSLTDKAPKPGEYKYMTQGELGLGDLILTFTILTREKNPEVTLEAKKMLQGAGQKLPPQNNEKKDAGHPDEESGRNRGANGS